MLLDYNYSDNFIITEKTDLINREINNLNNELNLSLNFSDYVKCLRYIPKSQKNLPIGGKNTFNFFDIKGTTGKINFSIIHPNKNFIKNITTEVEPTTSDKATRGISHIKFTNNILKKLFKNYIKIYILKLKGKDTPFEFYFIQENEQKKITKYCQPLNINNIELTEEEENMPLFEDKGE